MSTRLLLRRHFVSNRDSSLSRRLIWLEQVFARADYFGVVLTKLILQVRVNVGRGA